MGYWEPLARIVEWPREDGNVVRALWAAGKTQYRPRVRIRVRLCRPKVRRSNNGALSEDRSQQVGAARKCKPSADRVAMVRSGAAQRQVVPALERPPKVRKTDK